MILQSINPPELKISRLCHRLRLNTEGPQSQMYQNLILKLQSWMKEHVKIYAVSCIGSHSFFADIPAVDSCRFQILSLCTVVEKKADNYDLSDVLTQWMSQEKYIEAYLLGEMLNECLFSASNQVVRMLARHLEEEGCFLACRYAAGEDGIPLSNQKKYLDIIKKECPSKVPVQIMDSGMLQPQHTILFVYGADKCTTGLSQEHGGKKNHTGLSQEPGFRKNSTGLSLEHDCRNCSKTGCAFRIIQEATKELS